MDPTEYNDIEDDLSDEDIHNESNTLMIADDDLSDRMKQAAHFEQIPTKQNHVKCLKESELKRLMDQILSGYSTCGVNVKKKVNGIILSLHEICAADGLNCGVFNREETSDEIMDDVINDFIQEHNVSFLPGTNNFTPGNGNTPDYICPSMNQMRR